MEHTVYGDGAPGFVQELAARIALLEAAVQALMEAQPPQAG